MARASSCGGCATTSARPDLRGPAFYALPPGGWRDLITLLHPPYTAWHLSYVALGAAAAPHVHAGRVAAALGAFFLAVGVAAHALDELDGRPLGTRLTRGFLLAAAVVGLGGAVAIGVAGVIVVSPVLAPLVAAGALLVPAYNLRLWSGRVHTDTWFALAWGGFPALTGYVANALTVRPAGLLVAAGCCLLSTAQRRLSTPARELRRRTEQLTGTQRLIDGTEIELSPARVAAPLEAALRALSLAVVLLAAGLLALRL